MFQYSWKLRELTTHKKKQRSFVTHHRSLMDVHVGEIHFTRRVFIAHDMCALCDLRLRFNDHLKHHQDNKSLKVLGLGNNSIGDQGAIALAGSLKARLVMRSACFSPQARW